MDFGKRLRRIHEEFDKSEKGQKDELQILFEAAGFLLQEVKEHDNSVLEHRPFSPELLKSLYLHHHIGFLQPQPAPERYWLGESEFSTDMPVKVSVEQGRLVIEPVKDLRVKEYPGASWPGSLFIQWALLHIHQGYEHFQHYILGRSIWPNW